MVGQILMSIHDTYKSMQNHKYGDDGLDVISLYFKSSPKEHMFKHKLSKMSKLFGEVRRVDILVLVHT